MERDTSDSDLYFIMSSMLKSACGNVSAGEIYYDQIKDKSILKDLYKFSLTFLSIVGRSAGCKGNVMPWGNLEFFAYAWYMQDIETMKFVIEMCSPEHREFIVKFFARYACESSFREFVRFMRKYIDFNKDLRECMIVMMDRNELIMARSEDLLESLLSSALRAEDNNDKKI